MDTESRASLRSLAATAAVVATIITLGLMISDYVTLVDLAMLSLVVVMLAALVGRGLALLAVSLAVLTLDYFMPPRFVLAIQDPRQLATVGIMLGAGLSISLLTTRLRLKERDAHDREQRTAALLAFTRDVAAATDIRGIADVAVSHVEDIIRSEAVVLLPAGDRLVSAAGSITLDPAEAALARLSYEQSTSVGRGTAVQPDTHLVVVPLRTVDRTVGALVVREAPGRQGIDPDQRLLLDAVASQTGFAIGRAHLAEEAREATLRARTEEMRSSLLSTVSHDLRTPLGVITGAATSLRDDASHVGVEQRARLLDTIVDEAQRLERVLQNLLGITRLEAGLEPAREWVPIEELCWAALDRLADLLADRTVRVDVPPGLLISVDPVLFEQVFINLIENAVKHGAPPIDIHARRQGDMVEFAVRDRGPGLPTGCEARVFDKFFRVPGRRVPGVGLGLTVCRGIVEAHGGTIRPERAPDGNPGFLVVLPTARPPAGLVELEVPA